jgi:uncharacterized membrane protein YbhN (UPF0104 family)
MSPLLLAVITVHLIAHVFVGLRLKQVLEVYSVRLRAFATCRLNLQSMFYFVFLPMGFATELSRFARIRSLAPATRNVPLASALVLDRFVGLSAFLFLSLLSASYILPRIQWSPNLSETIWLIVLVLPVVGMGVALLWRLGYVHKVKTLLTLPDLNWGKLLVAFLLSLLMCSFLVTSVYLGGWAVGIIMSWVEVAFVIMTSSLCAVIPVMILGVGPMDIAGVFLYQLLGLTSTDALLMASILYFLRVFVALLGGAWILFERLCVWLSAAFS